MTEGNPKDSPQGCGLQSLLLKDMRDSHLRGNDEGVINQPAKAGFFMYGAPGEFGSDSCSKKLPGAIFHDQREPEGQPTGK